MRYIKLLCTYMLIFGFTVHLAPNPTKASVNTVPIHNLYLPVKNSTIRTQKITHVMLHFISNAATKPQNPYNIEDIYQLFSKNGISAHYMIDRNGAIFRLVGEERVAFHAGKGSLPEFPAYTDRMNEFSIGIELLAIGTKNEMLPMMSEKTYNLISRNNIGYTEAQYRSLNSLLKGIFNRHPSIGRSKTYVVGHDEYAVGRKTDPGQLFEWSRVNFKRPGVGLPIHTVVKGESLYQISRKYSVSIGFIADWSGIDPTKYLQVGQQLTIPIYTVQSGDSMWKIAQRYSVSVESIANINSINPNSLLWVGQKLIIP
ncbi:LysM peptidoglycan-binding domain-containing protein [Peribacillus acanthi]|uniref:LysM peptidoglycan-binding domain-containing protein n=1 Tax=Peribacillus acanthi TaxID=2171554 RepID=UPI000D3EBDB7|nr:LysM peptidoglycan-binding domain-containing protein [Peribacillus acanthi]